MKFAIRKQYVIKFMSLAACALFVMLSMSSVRAEALSDIEKVRAEVAKIIPATSDAKIIATGAENVFQIEFQGAFTYAYVCLLYTSPSSRDQRGSRMPSSA